MRNPIAERETEMTPNGHGLAAAIFSDPLKISSNDVVVTRMRYSEGKWFVRAVVYDEKAMG